MNPPFVIPQHPDRTFPHISINSEFVFDFLIFWFCDFLSPSPSFLTTSVSLELPPCPLLLSPFHWSLTASFLYSFSVLSTAVPSLTHSYKGNKILPVPPPSRITNWSRWCLDYFWFYFGPIQFPVFSYLHKTLPIPKILSSPLFNCNLTQGYCEVMFFDFY